MVMLGSLDSALPPKSERRVSLRKPPRQLSLGQDPLPASPLISTRNLVPGLSYGVVKLDRLGKGATSDVWRGIHVASLKVLALKEIVVSTDADRRAVRTEMRALRTQRSPLLNSTFTTELKSCPRIVDFYGSVVRENGNACIAVEYIAGGSLGSWLESGYKCPEPWIAHIAQQTLEALDFLHTGGRVHRDVKPANILITRKGDAKLGDFGAAGVENSSRMVGTQRFMAPERLKGHRASPQSDLWSLGLSLATAAVGDDFISQASNEFEQLDLAGSARSLLAKTKTISPEMRDFLHRCLSRDPARRPALRELMKHPFLKQRHDWVKKCPEVMVAMRENKRRQRESPTALSTKSVLDILCEARAEGNLVDSPLDTATADDLAYELGVTAESLVRSVHRGTLELIRERSGRGIMRLVGGSTRGVEDLKCDTEKNKCRRDRSLQSSPNEENLSVSQAETSFSNLGESSRNLYLDSEGSYSSVDSLPSMVAAFGGEESGEVAPLATVGDIDKVTTGHSVNSKSTGSQSISKPAGNFVAVMHSSGTRKRVVEISPAVKLTPQKRRGEKRSLHIKRHGSSGGDMVGSKSEQMDVPDVVRDGGNLKIDARSNGKPSATAEGKTSEGVMDEVCSTPKGEEGSAVIGCNSSWRREVEKQHRLVETRKSSVRTVFEVADEMKAQMVVRDRVYRLRVYPDCFSGREAVQWMLDRCHASSVVEAEKLGNEMMKASVFQHILNSQIFEDSSAYYQFTDGVTPPPPAKGGRRIRQVARVWGGHVARKFVHHGGGTSSGSNGSHVTRGVERDNGATSRSASSRCPAAQARGCNDREGVVDGIPSEHPTVCSFRQPVEMGIKNQPKLPKVISGDLKKHRRSRRHSAGKCQSQQRRFSGSVSSILTAPETPY